MEDQHHVGPPDSEPHGHGHGRRRGRPLSATTSQLSQLPSEAGSITSSEETGRKARLRGVGELAEVPQLPTGRTHLCLTPEPSHFLLSTLLLLRRALGVCVDKSQTRSC